MNSLADLSTYLSKNKHYLPAFISLLIIGGVAFFCLNSVSQIVSNQQATQRAETEIEQIQAKIVRLNNLQQGELLELHSIVNQALPPEKPVFNSLQAVTSLAIESGVFVSELQSRPGSVATPSASILVNPQTNTTNEQRKFSQLTMSLELEGPFSATSEFLRNLLDIVPLMELKTVRITTGRAGGEGDEFSSEVELDIYWRADNNSSQNTNQVQDFSSDQLEILSDLEDYRVF